MCVAMATSLTLLLPGEYKQHTSSHSKQKKNHYDGWSEDVLNHIQAAKKPRVYVVMLLRMNQHGGGLQKAAVGDRGTSCARQGLPITAGVGWSGCQLGIEQGKTNSAKENGALV